MHFLTHALPKSQSECLAFLPLMRQPPPAKIKHDATPRPCDDLPVKGAAEDTEEAQQYHTNSQNHGKRPPIALDRELQARELDTEISCHKRDGHKHDCHFREKQGDSGEAFDTEGFLDGDEVEVLVRTLEGKFAKVIMAV
jgi:hypothetical protein